MTRLRFSIGIVLTIIGIVLTISVASTLYCDGYHISFKFPFIFRESDQHPYVSGTCGTLQYLGFAIKEGLENKAFEIGQLNSFQDIECVLNQHNLAPERRLAPETGLALSKDQWGNQLKVKTSIGQDAKIFLIYSDTRNEFPMLPEGYNIFVELAIDANRKVVMTYTHVENNGRIVLKKL